MKKSTTLLFLFLICVSTIKNSFSQQFKDYIGGTGEGDAIRLYQTTISENGYSFYFGNYEGDSMSLGDLKKAKELSKVVGEEQPFIASINNNLEPVKILNIELEAGSYPITTDTDDNLYLGHSAPGISQGHENLVLDGDTVLKATLPSRILISKFDKDLNHLFSIEGNFGLQCRKFACDKNNNFYAFLETGYGDTIRIKDFKFKPVRYNIVKFNSNGEVIWHLPAPYPVQIDQMGVNENGEVVIAGGYNGSATVNFGNGVTLSNSLLSSSKYDLFYAKYNTDGIVQWAKNTGSAYAGMKVGGTPTPYFDNIVFDHAQNIYLSGAFSKTLTIASSTFSSPNTNNPFLTKVTTSGDPVWSKTLSYLSATEKNIYNFLEISFDMQDNLYLLTNYATKGFVLGDSILNPLAYSISTTQWLYKLDQDFNLIWHRQFGTIANVASRGLRVVDNVIYHANDQSASLGYVSGFVEYNNVKYMNVSASPEVPEGIFYGGVYGSVYTMQLYADNGLVTNVKDNNSIESEFGIFPNPVATEINLVGVGEATDYKIYNLVGQLIAEGLISRENNIDVNELQSGVYQLMLFNTNGVSQNLKFTKE